MHRNGKHASWLKRGSFPNSISFQRSGWDRESTLPAYGTIRCKGEVTAIVWERDSLLDLMGAYPDMKQRMHHAMIEAIIRRLLSTPDGENVKDYMRVISQGWADTAVRQRKIKMMATTACPPAELADIATTNSEKAR